MHTDSHCLVQMGIREMIVMSLIPMELGKAPACEICVFGFPQTHSNMFLQNPQKIYYTKQS